MMVEGSQIDYRSHANDLDGILAEMRDFEKAIKGGYGLCRYAQGYAGGDMCRP